MLARRFTIVCLLATLFGMGFATLVTEAGRHPRNSGEVGNHTCPTVICQIPVNR